LPMTRQSVGTDGLVSDPEVRVGIVATIKALSSTA
jgi:hypothetical protein